MSTISRIRNDDLSIKIARDFYGIPNQKSFRFPSTPYQEKDKESNTLQKTPEQNPIEHRLMTSPFFSFSSISEAPHKLNFSSDECDSMSEHELEPKIVATNENRDSTTS